MIHEDAHAGRQCTVLRIDDRHAVEPQRPGDQEIDPARRLRAASRKQRSDATDEHSGFQHKNRAIGAFISYSRVPGKYCSSVRSSGELALAFIYDGFFGKMSVTVKRKPQFASPVGLST